MQDLPRNLDHSSILSILDKFMPGVNSETDTETNSDLTFLVEWTNHIKLITGKEKLFQKWWNRTSPFFQKSGLPFLSNNHDSISTFPIYTGICGQSANEFSKTLFETCQQHILFPIDTKMEKLFKNKTIIYTFKAVVLHSHVFKNCLNWPF